MTGGGTPSSSAPLDGLEIDALFAGWRAYCHIAVAVSGGADSMALMLLTHAWLGRTEPPPRITVLSVDHGLRSEAAGEAAWVKTQAARLGLPHETLAWTGAKPRADLQAAARAARYGLMLDYCRKAGIAALATAHTAEDQAETLLMRLTRGSGLDGLAAIGPLSLRGGIALSRPLLGVSRVRLEATLLAAGVIWIEDPSNYDRRFERVRVREALRAANALQLTPEKLALSARRLDRARVALEAATGDFLRTALAVHPAGYGELTLTALRAAPEEIAIRAITRLAQMFGGGRRPVRMTRIEALHSALMGADPHAATLGGCVFAPHGARLRVRREFGRIDSGRMALPDSGALLWDGRFAISAPGEPGLEAGALGPEGLAQLRAARGRIKFLALSNHKLPARIAHSLPALWRGDRLAFVPFAVFSSATPTFWLEGASAVFVGTQRFGTPADANQNHGFGD